MVFRRNRSGMGRCQQSIEGTIEHRPPIKCQLTANEGGGVGGGIYKNITEKGSKC